MCHRKLEVDLLRIESAVVIGIFTSRRCVRRRRVVVVVSYHLETGVDYTRVPLRPDGMGRRPSRATTSPYSNGMGSLKLSLE